MLPAFSLLAPCNPGASTPEYVTVIVDEIEREHSEIAAALDLWIDHLSLLDLDLAGKGRDVFFSASWLSMRLTGSSRPNRPAPMS